MTPELLIAITRHTLETALWVAAPILVSATLVSLLINIGQVMTSIQDPTVSTVPRLAAVGGILFFLMPWMLHYILGYTTSLFGDFRAFTR
ncbi:MAG TPA: flagellar biosynthetic protein FliQ [Candidatus Acidoferrales bacterium]|jgi:flagellar biosynthesis protein FliQ|nr:flagellar biosynthetic protein FliQ [Candidatus Acidoferrales bacterium]